MKKKLETFLLLVIAVCLITMLAIHVHSYVRGLESYKPYVERVTP